MEEIFIGPKTTEIAVKLLAITDDLGLPVESVKTSVNGFLVPSDVADEFLEGVQAVDEGDEVLEVEGDGVVIGEDGIPELSSNGEPTEDDIVLEGEAVEEVTPEPQQDKSAEVKKPAPKAAKTKEK